MKLDEATRTSREEVHMNLEHRKLGNRGREGGTMASWGATGIRELAGIFLSSGRWYLG